LVFTDPDDPEYLKQMRRPAEVKEDVRQMNDRSRVSVILNSEAFRRELEEVVEEQIKAGPHPASLLALQQITDLLLPHSRGQSGLVGRGGTCQNSVCSQWILPSSRPS
jgi:adducin